MGPSVAWSYEGQLRLHHNWNYMKPQVTEVSHTEDIAPVEHRLQLSEDKTEEDVCKLASYRRLWTHDNLYTIQNLKCKNFSANECP